MSSSDPAIDEQIEEYADNLFIDGLPPIASLRDHQVALNRPPLLTDRDRLRAPEGRLHVLLRLLRYSQPTVAARDLSMRIEHMVYQGYVGRNPLSTDWVRLTQAYGLREKAILSGKAADRPTEPTVILGDLAPMTDTSMSTLVAGPPGMGKTHAVNTALLRYRQVILHTGPITLAQIVFLRVECPPNGSLVSLCRYFFAAVDTALGKAGVQSNLEGEYKRAPLAVLLVGMARVANLHGIGLLVIDEIQHVKVANAEGSSLLNFLVTLRNAIGVSLLMVGTMSALQVVQRTFRDARRGDGLGSILFARMAPSTTQQQREDREAAREALVSAAAATDPAKTDEGGTAAIAIDEEQVEAAVRLYGADFAQFVGKMWRHQYTNVVTELTVPLLNALYDETQGITDLLVKLFVLVQARLISRSASKKAGDEVITPRLVHDVAEASFNSVRPFIRALRENDQVALAKFEDLIDFHQWFADHVHGIGLRDAAATLDTDHGTPELPPIARAGGIGQEDVDAILEGMQVKPADRAAVVSRHAELIERNDLAALVMAVRKDVDALRAAGAKPPKMKRAEPIEDDLRRELDGVTDAAEVARRVGVTDLDEIV